jgi:D-alanyl-D-alanine carboxypeptidase/D-alanyl-D-alanine-endopeptidase (penicillin-binding protein 4)
LLIVGCVSEPHELLYNRKPAFYSYIVGDVDSDFIDVEHLADVYTAPASCQKIIIALLAYKTLGRDFRFETNLYLTKHKSEIQDVIIVASGDPTLKSENLKELLEPLRGKPVKGKIVIDTSAFQTPEYSKNNMINDMGSSYAPPISSFSLDQNIIAITLYPTKIGEKVVIENDGGYRIEGNVVTTVEPSSVKLSWENGSLTATGTMKVGDQPLTLKISPIDLKDYISRKIKPILKNLGLKNKVVFVKDGFTTSLNKDLFTSVVSESLRKIIPPALKKSDNFVFDSVYLKLIHGTEPSMIKDWSDGDKVIKALIKENFKVDMEKAHLVDGSGLSRYNRLQPRQLFKILQKGYTTTEFVAALANPGEANSTLVKRTSLPAMIKAKTGNLSGISCLCGYRIMDNHNKAFVIIANSFSPPAGEMFPILDGFVANYLAD